MRDLIEEQGFALAGERVPLALVEALRDAVESVARDTAGRRGGLRNVLDELPEACALARCEPVRAIAEEVLGPGCFAVRGLLFDKTPEANWKVRWHQDLTVAVREQREVPGFGPWTEKHGVTHAHAPDPVLARMVALRIHVDDCGEDNGPLRVAPGSHRAGRIPESEFERWTSRPEGTVTCLARRGEVLAFRPLLLHASSPALRPGHRRVLQLEFAVGELADGLEWRWRV